MTGIQSITTQSLIDAIEAAERRVVFVAPGIWPELARPLAEAWERLDPEQVSVILDIDAEVCRFGYGSIEGLQQVKETANRLNQAIGHEAGIRICIVITDEQTFIFSPTPRLIESSPDSPSIPGIASARANGIVLTTAPATIERDLGATPEQLSEKTIGMKAADPAKIEAMAKDLKLNPPKTFDIARAVNVYNAAIQFVEFEVAGCRLSSHKAKLPPELLKIARNNPDLDKKIDKSLYLIKDDDDLINNNDLSEKTVFAERKRIEEIFLVHVKGGTVIDRKQKEAFIRQVRGLEELVKQFANRVSKTLNKHYLSTADELATELLPNVMNDIPEGWVRKLGTCPKEMEVKFLIKESLMRSFGNPELRIKTMKVSHVFKDVTYEMLKEPGFAHKITEHFPNLKPMEEYTAAKEASESNFELKSE